MPRAEPEPAGRMPAGASSEQKAAGLGRLRFGWRLEGPLASAIASLLAAGVAALLLSGSDGDTVRVAAVFVGLGAVALSMETDRWLLGAAALVRAWWVAVLAVRYVPDVTNPGPPVGQAVGAAAFFDTPYRGPQIAAALSVAIPTLIAVVAAVVSALRDRGSSLGNQEAIAHSTSARSGQIWSGGAALTWGGVALLAFALIPDLRSYLQQSGQAQSYYWDVSNVISWKLFVQMGLVPMKDFFYPYGFQWLYTEASTGPLFQWLVQVATLILAGWSLRRLSGGRTWRVLACLAAMVLVGVWHLDSWRFIPALVVPVSYAAVGPLRHTRPTRAHAGFFAACLLALFVGPDILVIGLGGVLMVAIGELVAARISLRSWSAPIALAVDALPVVVSGALMLLVWLIMGAATAYIRFLEDFAAVSSSSALNERAYGPLGQMVLYPATYSLWAAGPALLAAAGLLVTRLQRDRAPGVGAVLLAGSGVSLVMLLKHLVRPISDQMLMAPLIAIAWAVILVWPARSLVRAAACGAALGAFLALLHTTANADGGRTPGQFLSSALSSPAHLVRSILVAFDPGARARAARAAFDRSRFLGWPDTTITTEYLEAVRAPPVPPFAIVGDSPMTYALLRQRPPFHVDMYDAAPIAEQNAMVSLLERRHPPYLIWRKDYGQDALPYTVRDPVVFAWMIQHYVPLRVFGIADVLRRRAPGQAIPGAFWRSQLGGGEDLGYIPSFSSAASSPACTGGAGCVTYVLVNGRPHGGNPGIGVVLTGNGVAYGLLLRMRAGVEVYAIRLDRLWFSRFVGPGPAVSSLTPGFSVRLVGLRSGQNLY